MKNKMAETLEAVHTHTHTHTQGFTTKRKGVHLLFKRISFNNLQGKEVIS